MTIGDWEIDETLALDGVFYHKPPDGHPRRCQGYNNERLQCKNWAVRNAHYCHFHRGRVSRKRTDLQLASNRYTRRLSSTFKQLLEEQEKDREKIADLSDEVEVARTLCEESVKMVDAVFFDEKNKDEEGKDKASSGTKMAVLQHAQGSLVHVANLCEKLTKVKAISEGTLDADQVQHLMTRIVRVLRDELEEDPELFERVVRQIQHIKTPKKDAKVVVIG